MREIMVEMRGIRVEMLNIKCYKISKKYQKTPRLLRHLWLSN